MRFIGNKTQLLDNIKEVIDRHAPEAVSFCDIFSGTASVARFFKQWYEVHSNDLLYFSYCLQRGTIENPCKPSFLSLKNSFGIDDPISYFNDMPTIEMETLEHERRFFQNNYAPAGGRMYITDSNAIRIDYARNTIEDWKTQGLLSADEYYYLVACVIEGIPFVSNISGTYGAFNKTWDARSNKLFVLIDLPVVDNGRNNRSYNEDGASLLARMEAMSDAVSGLRDVPQFQQIFLLFTNPILGVLAGAVLTGIIQSSSASVGILQALASTGQVTFGAAIPIIMGQNIGTCVTALLSSVGTNKNARRAALVHLSFNVVGTVIWCAVFSIVKAVFAPAVLSGPATAFNIAVAHSAFNIACTALLLPCSSLLEKLAYRLIPEDKKPEELEELDERLLTTPPIALQRCRSVMLDMAKSAVVSLHDGLELVEKYDADTAKSIRSAEELTDHYEDILGSYLVKLSTLRISGTDSTEAAMYLKMISDFERIADHSVGMLEAVEEMRSKGVNFSENAQAELKVLTSAVGEIVDLTLTTFVYNDVDCAKQVEPLQQVIAHLKETMRTRHILRLQNEKCSIEAGFVWSDLLTNLERTADHCSNIAGCVIDIAGGRMNLHSSLRDLRSKNEGYRNHFDAYKAKYSL